MSKKIYQYTHTLILLTGKGDLVGCDISQHLQKSSASGPSAGVGGHPSSIGVPEVLVKSSSDIRLPIPTFLRFLAHILTVLPPIIG